MATNNGINNLIFGRTNGVAVAVGYVGEQIQSIQSQASPISLSTGVYTDITNVALTAGYWQIEGVIGFRGTITTTQTWVAFFGTAAGNNTTGIIAELNTLQVDFINPDNNDWIAPMPTYIVNNSSSQTYYLKAETAFLAGTYSAWGSITATRIG